MVYQLGVDLGTTFTAAAVANGEPPTMLGLGNRAMQVPSVLFLQPDGEFLAGEAAERRGAVDPNRVAREFKRRIGDHVPILVGGTPHSAHSLTAHLLRWVVEAASERMGDRPGRITVTHPANWGAYRKELLEQAILLADVGDARTCPEPTAAAVQYASQTRVPVGARIAIYDLGGGTFDVCVLEKLDVGFTILGEPQGVEQLGGIDFDEALFRKILHDLGEPAARLDFDDPTAMAGLVRLRRDCVEAKEALSSDVDTAIPVSLPGLNTPVRITRSELEDLIRPSLQETVAAMTRALRSAGVESSHLHSIVLIGGSSRIPLVTQLLRTAFDAPTALDTHPKHDIALGAVRVYAEETAQPTESMSPLPGESIQNRSPSPPSGTSQRADDPSPTKKVSVPTTVRVPGFPSAEGGGTERAVSWWLAGRFVAAVIVVGLLAWLGWWLAHRNADDNVSATNATSATSGTTNATTGETSATTSVRSVVTRQVTVPGNQFWIDTALACMRGDVLDITATGTVQHNTSDPKSTVDPNGLTEPWFHQFNVPGLPDANTVALIGALDQAHPFVVGTVKQLTCDQDGKLYLGINDMGVSNNAGQFVATVTITPASRQNGTVG